MITPERAPVRPRVKRKGDETAYLLEDEIAELAHEGRRGVVVLSGRSGSGKTTAVSHLAAVLAPSDAVELHDPDPAERDRYGSMVPIVLSRHTLVVTTMPITGTTPIAALELVPWGQDEWIEYLLACYPQQCKSVMARLMASDDSRAASYPAEICRVVLEEMAADETVSSPLDAMICRLNRRFTREQQLALSPSALDGMRGAQMIPWAEALKVVADIDRPSWRLVNQPQVLSWIAAAYAVRIVKLGLPKEDARCLVNIFGLPRSYLYNLAAMVRRDQKAIEHLYRIIHSSAVGCHASALSVLHLAGALSSPSGTISCPGCQDSLDGAILEAVQWPGVVLQRLRLRNVDFSGANLAGADLSCVQAQRADFNRANLRGASLPGARLPSAILQNADLTAAHCPCADYSSADCRRAIFSEAYLCDAQFCSADLTSADFRKARMAGAVLRGAEIDGADFTGADLACAGLDGLNLTAAQFRNADFAGATMVKCVLDEMDLPGAKFDEANLTDSTFTGASMPGANFSCARLRGCGLADVDWEGADLRYADLRGAVFSMGGSRSGLVGSPYPGHGSRTGFYTDDFNDLSTHKHPEEIRKANLCGVDLRGADIEGVDFYLVDLRGARYDAEQAEQLLRCGAILREPVA